jgi:exo-beta-1,3-glucanase (GH17 family)
MKSTTRFLILPLLSLLLVSCDGSKNATHLKSTPPSFKANVAKIDLTDDIWDGHAICYGGFREGQRPGGASPSDLEILEDMKILEKNWNLIRFYNANEHGEAVLRVITENKIDLKVMLGIYIFQTKDISGDELAANETLNQFYISEGLRLAKTYPDIIAGINIGNEVLVSWSFVPNEVETIIQYVQQVSDGLDAAGLDIPLTVADNYAFWESPEALALAAKLDFITVHGYAMWDGFGIADAVAFLAEHFAAVKKNIPDKPIIVGETGWATYAEDAQIYGSIGAEANEVNAEIYFHRISAWAETRGITTMIFEAFDEPWKSGGVPGAAEGHWGVFDANRKAKLVMHQYYPELVSDVPTSPDYSGFVFTPSVNVGQAFRATTVTELAIDSTAEALDSCSLSESSTAYEGSQSLMFDHDGAAKGGFYSLFAPPLIIDHDHVVFALSGVPSEAKYFELKFEGGGAGHTVNILSYTPVSDGIWDIYTLPLNDFGAVDFNQVNAMGFWHPFSHATHKADLGHYVAAQILIDDIHFE